MSNFVAPLYLTVKSLSIDMKKMLSDLSCTNAKVVSLIAVIPEYCPYVMPRLFNLIRLIGVMLHCEKHDNVIVSSINDVRIFLLRFLIFVLLLWSLPIMKAKVNKKTENVSII